MPGNSTGCGPYAARHGPGSAPRRDRPPWTNFKEVAWLVVLHPVLLFVGPQHLSRAMGHRPLRRHIGQQHKTAQLLHLAGDDLRPLVERSLQAIPPRFDHAGLLLAWP